MSKISEVFYKEIDAKKCSIEEAGTFYYYFNLLNIDERFHEGYENYELGQIKLRNEIIADAIKDGELPKFPSMNSIILGISSMKNKVILISDF